MGILTAGVVLSVVYLFAHVAAQAAGDARSALLARSAGGVLARSPDPQPLLQARLARHLAD